MKYGEVHMPVTLRRQKRVYNIFTAYFTEMQWFALQVKRPPFLPTVRDQTDIAAYRRYEMLEALAFDSGVNFYSNATGGDTSRATP
jgi:hypothetical protein